MNDVDEKTIIETQEHFAFEVIIDDHESINKALTSIAKKFPLAAFWFETNIKAILDTCKVTDDRLREDLSISFMENFLVVMSGLDKINNTEKIDQ